MGTKKKEEKALSYEDFLMLLAGGIMIDVVKATTFMFFVFLLDLIPSYLGNRFLVILFELMKWFYSS